MLELEIYVVKERRGKPRYVLFSAIALNFEFFQLFLHLIGDVFP